MLRTPLSALPLLGLLSACSSDVATPKAQMVAATTMGAASGTTGTGGATTGEASMVGGSATPAAAAMGVTSGTMGSSTDGAGGDETTSATTSTSGVGGQGTGTTVANGGSDSGNVDSGGGSGGGTSTAADVFGSCRFHFGAIDRFARDNPSIAAELDFFTPGWMGNRDTFDQGYVCDDTAPGGPLEGLVPVVVAYVAAFYAKRNLGVNDCNVGSPDLCTHGALYIKQNLDDILNVYRSYAQGYADCYGTERPIVFEMEPDYFQYTYDSQTDPLSPSEAGSIMSQFVGALREQLPNAVFSIDISPWVDPDNGSDHGAEWYSNFDMSLFTFVNTSGGSTDASSEKIRDTNNMTWAGVSAASGKRVLADTGYGVNGSSAGHDQNWDNPAYINARIADGVASISQYNPSANWGSTIAQIRDQLDAPVGCR